MYSSLLRLYQSGRLTEPMLKEAIRRKWITEEQAEEIRNSKPKDTQD